MTPTCLMWRGLTRTLSRSELARVLGPEGSWGLHPSPHPPSPSRSPTPSSFTVAGADVQTLRERLIDALESHSDTWPPACPPLEPAR